MEHIGPMAYRLQLPTGLQLHPVFHVSNLKPKVGDNVQVQGSLPPLTEEGVVQPQPEAILQRRMVKRGNCAVTKVLVQWAGLPPEDLT